MIQDFQTFIAGKNGQINHGALAQDVAPSRVEKDACLATVEFQRAVVSFGTRRTPTGDDKMG